MLIFQAFWEFSTIWIYIKWTELLLDLAQTYFKYELINLVFIPVQVKI